MSSDETSAPADRWYRARCAALVRVVRAIRHEMATPLSGSLLHVELVRRMLRLEKIENLDLEKSVRAVQEGLDEAADLLDQIGERVTGTPAPAEFSGIELVRKVAGRYLAPGAKGQVVFEFPDDDSGTTLFGSSEELEGAISDITAFALEHCAPGTPVAWAVSSAPGERALSCRFESALSPERLEAIRSSWRLAGGSEQAAEGGLLFAGWAIEAQGGRFSLARKGDILEARAVFAAEEVG